ncbi:hypothetical protein U3516DRAFT_771921, partial [Neocallimastix sp. 'constans']
MNGIISLNIKNLSELEIEDGCDKVPEELIYEMLVYLIISLVLSKEKGMHVQGNKILRGKCTET